LLSTRKYDVYGAIRGSSGPSGTRHKFVGQLGHPSDDETGLIYMRARYMDPVTGRFVSEDPAQNGANWYIYCSNNATNKVDPNGHQEYSLLGISFASGLAADLAQFLSDCINVAGGGEWSSFGTYAGAFAQGFVTAYLIGWLGNFGPIYPKSFIPDFWDTLIDNGPRIVFGGVVGKGVGMGVQWGIDGPPWRQQQNQKSH